MSSTGRIGRIFPRYFLLFTALLMSVVATLPVQAQSPQTLRNHVMPAVTQGTAPMVAAMSESEQMSFSIVLPLRNQSELTSLLKRLYDPSSPDYRQFLSVSEFTERFGPTAQDYETVASYARANGFTVADAPANRMVLSLSGTAAQVESAFGVRMNYYQHPTESRTFFSPDREPTVDLAVKIAHISGLNNFYLPRPAFQLGSNVQSMASVNGSGPGGSYLGSDMRAAYYGGSTLDGNGQVVGLLEFEGYNKSDVDLTFTNAGQTYKVPVTNVLLNGMTGAPVSSGGEAEVVLDIVQAIGMAPGLKQVRVYIGNNDASMLNSMASENLAKQIGCSWSWRPDDPAVADPFFQEMAAQGQSFFTASGDNGAFAANVPFYFPAEDTYVTAVGGTHLTTSGAGGSWVSETAWNSSGYGTGGGVSPDSIGIPSWQAGLATTANGGSTTLRNVPDVAMEADFDNYMCYMGTCITTGAGTSFAAPRWAGFMAMVNQQAIEAGNAPKGGLGFINPTIYAIGSDSRFATEMHDTTSGNNQTAGQSVWYSAVTGYDLVTGWGSANGQNLIDELAGRQVPGFWIAAADGTVSLNQGKTSSTTITVTDAADFTGSVNLAVTSTLPTGVTATWGTNPTTNTSVLTFTATASAPESSTPVTITGTSGSLTATTTLTLAVHQPSFTLSPSPATVSVNPGNSVTSTITVTPKYGFSGDVTLAASGLPAGVTATWGTNPTTGSSVLTLATSSSTLGGTYPITITGTSGSITATTTVSAVIQAPSFRISGYGSVNIGKNASGSAYFYVTPLYGFTGNVNFTVSGLPTGVSAYFSPASSAYSSTLYLSASGATPGQYTVTVTGTSGSLTASTTFILGIYEPSFTLSSNGSVDVGQGSSTSAYVYVSGQYGFNSNVNLSVSGLPSGVSVLWNPNPTTYSSTLSLITSSSVPTGQYTLTISGKSGSLSASTTLKLNVYAPTFSISGYSNVTIGQGSTATNYVYVSPQYGFNGSVNLSVSGLPSGVTAAFSPNPTTGSSNLTFTASSSTAVGQYPLTITGTSGTITKTFSTTLSVYTPTFTLSGSGTVNIGQGTSGTGYLYVNGQYGFSGNVNLSVSGLPSGVTATFSPNPTTGSSQITFAAASSVAVGQYPLTITGTSGSKTVTMTMTLGVYTPTFTLSGYGASIGQGTSGSGYVYVNTQYGFSSPVTLSATGVPSGVTATFLSNPTTGSTTITFAASSSAATGQYPITITGTSGSLTATTTLTLSVYAPSFTLYSYGVSMGQGSTASGYVYVNSQYGYPGSVTLSASGLPAGLTASFTTNPTTSSSQVSLTSSSALAPGQYPITITGTSGSLTATTSLVVSVYAAGFSINTPYFGSANPGTTQTGTVTVNPQYGFSGNVTLSATGLPSGVTASFSPNPTTGSSIMTLTLSNSATPGYSQITVSGVSGSVTAVGSTSLTVNQQSFTVSSAPGVLNLSPGTTAKSSVMVKPLNGFSGSVNFTATGLPSGVTASFSPNPTTGSAIVTFTADNSATVGSGTVTITGTSNGGSASTALTVNVVAASTATSTSLSAISNGTAVTSIGTGSPIALTAAVTSGATAVTSGEVIFCQDAGTTCDVGHRFASALLGSGGKAVVRLIPGPGVHSYGATFLGSNGLSASTSSAVALTVTATLPTTTTLSSSGSPGNYTLSSTVTGQGRLAPGGTVSFVDVTSNNGIVKALTLSPSQTNASFATSASAVGSTSLYGLASGDFNGDGVTDLAVGNSYSKQLTILLGKGDGTFTATSQGLTTTSQPLASVAGDFNGDGKLDLAVACSNANALLFFLGNGDGTFQSSTALTTGNSPVGLVAEDFNRDGKLDVAVANSYSNTVNIFLGNGDVTFTNNQSPQTGNSPRAIIAADFNKDGLIDLAVANSDSTLTILLGSGDGSFTAALSPSTGSYPVAIAASDLNGDGITDLAVANSSSSTATILLGNGDGTFTASVSVVTSSNPGSIVAGDFNGDGKQDLVLASTYQNGVSLIPGKGDGTFGASVTTSSGTSPSFLLAGDYNGDGVPDIAALNASSGLVTTLVSKWVQTASASAAGVFPFGQGQHQVKASYAGDASYQGSSSSAITLTAQAGPPAVTVTPASATISVLQPLTVAVNVGAGSGYPTPSGTVTLTSGSYSAQQTLASGAASFTVPANALVVGNDTLTAAYVPDASSTSTYTNASGTAAVKVTSAITPTVTVTPAASNITTAQPLSVSVGVAGGNGNPTPTGTVTLTSGSYSAQQTLSSGSATFSIAAGTLAVGNDTLAVAYAPDTSGATIYTSANGSGAVTVTQVIGSGSAALAMTVSPAVITDKQAATVSISVAGPSGQAVPTGTVTLSSSTYTSQLTLANGSASVSVAGSSLSSGSNTLSVTYSGDANYASTTGSGTVTVTPVVAAGATPSPVNRGSNTTSTITFNAGSGYSGTMNVVCALTASPSGAQNAPTCSLSPSSFSLTAGGSGTTTLTIRTTAPTSAALTMPGNPRSWGAGLVVAAFALPVLWCMPRRRKLIPLLMLLMAITITIGSSGCAGGGKSSSSGSTGSTGTTTGSYTFTVTGTDATNTSVSATTAVTVTVQ
ncbi:FG-GAP-like repeat-containing protein [Terriglobus albidus]|nr:FG-GAP-like repeat-containing protein [Terriglobus albidus]